ALVARALNLRRLTSSGVSRGLDESARARIVVEIERVGDKKRDRGEAAGMKTFYQGDEIRFRLRNPGRTSVDVTLLYANAKFGIERLLPLEEESNRVEAGKTVTVPPVDVDSKTAGQEYVVVIAVKSDGALMDFAALAQPSVEGVRGAAKERGSKSRGLK